MLHIGVGLERHYNIGYQRQPQVLLVCDTSNAMVRMIEAILQRKYPQLEIAATISQREYEQREAIDEDFVISTVRIGEKDKPVVTIAPFPTDYQLDQIGKLVLVDRTRPWMLNKYFDAAHFRVIDKPIDQQTLFAELCQQLLLEGLLTPSFMRRWWSVRRSSVPCSAMALRCHTPWDCWPKDGGVYGYRPSGHRLGRRNCPYYLPARYQ